MEQCPVLSSDKEAYSRLESYCAEVKNGYVFSSGMAPIHLSLYLLQFTEA